MEPGRHSFVLRVWLEETAMEAGRAIWRGHITHHPGGERRYVQSLAAIAAFIVPYLEEMGVARTTRPRVRRWLEQWTLRLTRLK